MFYGDGITITLIIHFQNIYTVAINPHKFCTIKIAILIIGPISI